jgi:hypothetical protein
MPSELPPAIGRMMEDQPCQPRLRVPLDQHVLIGSDRSGSHPFLISAGEKLCFVGDSPKELKLVDAAVPIGGQGPKWVSVEFQVFDDIGSILVIRHHFDRPLGYRSLIKVHDRPPQPTSVCPVRPNLASLEHWPYPIELVAFGDFASLEPNAPTGCR